ncbi:DGQHR domain-containing protein [Stenotrophomonas sp. VV52]|uniref:DGQHR domain-containing protein n=1 Tax=Stenotrophomonas sp. VV52 TaxID=2066958 RepID=UPI000C9EC604|nr:DGQHR domain-containing protein [Stenotrophomonas sp. VV52]
MAIAKAVKTPVAKKSSTSTMAKKVKKGNKASGKKVLTVQERAKRSQRNGVRSLFARFGFDRIKTDGVHFTFEGRTGEFDEAFVYENVLIMAEYTVGTDTSGHVSKKSMLYNKVAANQPCWMEFAAQTFPDLGRHFAEKNYKSTDYRVFICYFSIAGVSDEYEAGLKSIRFLDGAKLRYFQSLSKAIHHSARYELFSYLGLSGSDIAEGVLKSGSSLGKFEGHVLPESFSSFPEGFKVVSFYADPGTLLKMAYVLRRDSWRDPEGMYQRVLQKGRMSQMRRYLTTEERVFVNNIIVTLPSDTALNNPQHPTKNLNASEITKVRNANIIVPDVPNSIGIVDGQHRVFCYHEGSDRFEAKIKSLRGRQNLLVTGLIYPEHYSEIEKRKFEAKLFLEINDKQKRTGSELKQSIEIILNPYSTTSIAKAVIYRLNSSGPLKGFLQTNYFDPPSLIRTTSIVSYGLKPLLKLDGVDSLYTSWTNKEKSKLKDLQRQRSGEVEEDVLLSKYIEYSAGEVNKLLIGLKRADDQSRWKLQDSPKDRTLTPTFINGIIVCLRLMLTDGKLASAESYEKSFKGVSAFAFSRYKSSAWRKLGEKLYQSHFPK